MRITYLLEVADQLWGGVKVALEDANWLSRRGHQVTVVSRSGPPAWMQLDCAFLQVEDFRADNLPDGDVVVGTFWTTVPWAASAGPGKGAPVHFCQGYEGDNPAFAAVRDRIDATYRLPGLHHVTVSPHLTELLCSRFGIESREVGNFVDTSVHKPGPRHRPKAPLRVGLVGPYSVALKDLATGYAACELAHNAGQELVLVRASTEPPTPEEQDATFPVEWHQHLRPDQMGDFYRSLDVFLGTSKGAEEGFFLPAVEAMACGVPSVLTDIPCFRNHQARVGHERYALFVEPQDPRAMAEAMVLAGALPDVRATLRAGGIEVAGHYRHDSHGERLEAALAEIAASYSQRAPHVEPAATRRDLRLVATAAGTAPAQPAAGGNLQDLGASLRRTAAEALNGGRQGDGARAMAAALCLDEANPELRLESARAWLAAARPERALATLDDRGNETGHEALAQRLRANALHGLGLMQEAAQAVRASIAAGSRDADTYNLLGVTLFEAGRLEDARESFERALVLEPEHADALANLAAMPAA